LTSFSGGTLSTSGSDQIYGWYFDTSSAVEVTALGVGDASGGPLSVAHDVGIFSVSTTALLVSTTLPAGGGTLLDGFDYVSIAPFFLAAGDYVIAMTMPFRNADTQSISNTSETTSSPVTYVDSAFAASSTLVFPSIEGAFAQGLFGPNFTFTPASVPEPTGVSIMATMLLGVAFVARRRVARRTNS
jgi:hypothetical protein